MHQYYTTCLPLEQRTYFICKIKHKGQARDVLYGDGQVGNFPSGSNNSSDQMNNNWVGFRFSPTDEELINFYLKNKILGNSWLVDDWISEIYIYSYEPEYLPALSNMESNDLVWYFFSRNEYTSTKPRVRKRTTVSGLWKATGRDRTIKDKGGNYNEIGILKTLVYHKGKGSNVVRTPWVMHEYNITCLPLEQTYVICKIMYRGEYFPSGGNEVGSSAGNEVGSIPSAVFEVGNFSSPGNES
ncbi:unnamed protein product [Eruca vesicaria subsp. sativa]|uniref:NAC domain-containing protein n=1 Tax=Eruca vesicaria subsp. sativa TaxID=29727 RepID=A0ABC8L5I6_ERUVS|nr:unnamed protein product [Eruca vesicaria subsp. sativa]